MNATSPIPAMAAAALLWAAWCGLHSLLLWRALRGRVQRSLGLGPNAFRAWYSLAALVTALPVAWATRQWGGLELGLWPGPWLALQALMWGLGLGLMVWGWLSFRNGGIDLMGWEQAAHGTEEPPHLITSGAYAYTRHPMYAGSLLIIWARPLGWVDLAVNLVLSAYLYLGSLHEEGRMIASFGAAYRGYRRRVPWLPGTGALPPRRGDGN